MNTLFAIAPRFRPGPEGADRLKQALTGEIAALLDQPLDGLTQIAGGQGLTFIGQNGLGEPLCVLKVRAHRGYPDATRLEAVNSLDFGAGLRNPRFLGGCDEHGLAPYGYVVSSWLNGAPAAIGERGGGRYRRSVAMVIRAIADASVPDGTFQALGWHHDSYGGYVRTILDEVPRSFGRTLLEPADMACLVAAGMIEAGLLEAIAGWLAAAAEPLAEVPVHLLHGDLLPGNIIEAGDTPGLIDWDEVRVGGAAYELARIQFYLMGRAPAAELPGVTDIDGRDDVKRLALAVERVRLQLRELFKLAITPHPAAERVSLARQRGDVIRTIMAGEAA